MLGAQYTSIPDPREPVSVRPPDRVKGPLESRIAAALAWWVAQVSRRAVAVLVGAGAVTAVLSVYAALNLGVNSDQNDMFSQDLPHRILELEFAERFPLEDQNVVVLIDAATAERASDAAIALAEKLAERPDLFENIYLPRDAFFDEHGLLYMETDDLEVFADRLARVQPYLAGLAEDGSLRGLANMLERGAAAVRDGEVEGIELEPMLERFADAIDARLAGRPPSYSPGATVLLAGCRRVTRQVPLGNHTSGSGRESCSYAKWLDARVSLPHKRPEPRVCFPHKVA